MQSLYMDAYCYYILYSSPSEPSGQPFTSDRCWKYYYLWITNCACRNEVNQLDIKKAIIRIIIYISDAFSLSLVTLSLTLPCHEYWKIHSGNVCTNVILWKVGLHGSKGLQQKPPALDLRPP